MRVEHARLSFARPPDHQVSVEVASGPDLPRLEIFAECDDEPASRKTSQLKRKASDLSWDYECHPEFLTSILDAYGFS